MLAEYAAVADAVRQDVGVDLLGRLSPLGLGRGVVADRGQLRGPIQGDPAHQLRRDVVLRFAAGLPDALVRLAPGGCRALGL